MNKKICRKTSNSFSNKHTFWIIDCDQLGFARCRYCGKGFDEE